MTASEDDDVGVAGGVDGEGATDGIEGAIDGLIEPGADGGALEAIVGEGEGAAATVNVVVPWSRSPSAAEADVQRTV
jgi:hypothetical protein